MLRGTGVALEPVNESNKIEWWDTWTSDVLAVMGISQDAHDRAGRGVTAAGASVQLDGFAAVRALDNEGRLCKVVGGVGAVRVDDTTVELGLWLIPQHRGWGAGLDSLQIAIDHWRGQGFVVTIFTGIGNEPMIAVANKLGLKRIGAIQRKLPNGQIVDGVEFQSPS